MSELFNFSLEACLIVIGIIEFLKNLNFTKITKYLPYLSLGFSIILGVVYCYSHKTMSAWDITAAIGTCLATTQLSYEIIIKTIKDTAAKFISNKNSADKEEVK